MAQCEVLYQPRHTSLSILNSIVIPGFLILACYSGFRVLVCCLPRPWPGIVAEFGFALHTWLSLSSLCVLSINKVTANGSARLWLFVTEDFATTGSSSPASTNLWSPPISSQRVYYSPNPFLSGHGPTSRSTLLLIYLTRLHYHPLSGWPFF
jgi:hypothetical protein